MYLGQIYLGQATLPLHGWDEQIRRRATAHCEVEQLELGAGHWQASEFLLNSNLKANSMMNNKLKVHQQWKSSQLRRTNTQLWCGQLNLLRIAKGRRVKSHLSRYISSVITSLPVTQFVLCFHYLIKKKLWFEKKKKLPVCAHNVCTHAPFQYLRTLTQFYDYRSWLFSWGASFQLADIYTWSAAAV